MPETIRTLATQLKVDPEDISALVDQLVEDGEPFVLPLPKNLYYDLPLNDDAAVTITDQIKGRAARGSVLFCEPCRRVWDLDDVTVYGHEHAVTLTAREKLDADLR